MFSCDAIRSQTPAFVGVSSCADASGLGTADGEPESVNVMRDHESEEGGATIGATEKYGPH